MLVAQDGYISKNLAGEWFDLFGDPKVRGALTIAARFAMDAVTNTAEGPFVMHPSIEGEQFEGPSVLFITDTVGGGNQVVPALPFLLVETIFTRIEPCFGERI